MSLENRGEMVEALVEKIVDSMSDEDLVNYVMDDLYDYYIRAGDQELDEALDIYNVEG